MAIYKKKKKIVHLLAAEIAFGIFANVLSVWIFFKLSYGVLNQQMDLFDTIATYLVQMLRSPAMTEFMLIITMLGGPGILGVWIVTAFVLSAYNRNRRSLMFLVMTISGSILNLVLKYVFQRPRPTQPLVEEYFYSYPSGHAMNAFIFYLFIAYMYYHYTHNKSLGIVVFIVASMLVLLIGISRVYLGVHYPSDVLAGYIGGLWWLITVILFEKLFIAGWPARKGRK